MIDKDLFIKTVSGVWLNIFKKTYVPISEKIYKKPFLDNLFGEIQNFDYAPSNPREYIVSNKHNLVSRIIPILSIKDICVYYFCLKNLEDKLAVNRIEGTYGGFSMGGSIRKKEENEFNFLSEIPFSVSHYSYNSFAWVEAWRDFQKKAFIYSNQDDYSYFIKFDIANFYDCINLCLLDKKIRSTCENGHSEIIDLLFQFLKNWNKKFDKYFPKSVGVPQDEVGDCSRILANFYLQDFDKVFSDYCKNNSIQYLRYSDDMILMSKDELVAKRALFFASKELNKINLNINSSKVILFESKEKFDYYWAFDIFNKLGDKDNIYLIEKAIDDYRRYLDEEKNKTFRKESVLNRILNCNLCDIDICRKQVILGEVLQEDFLMNCEEHSLKRIYDILGNDDKQRLIKALDRLIDSVYFNKFHYILLKLNGIFGLEEEKIKQRINELKL